MMLTNDTTKEQKKKHTHQVHCAVHTAIPTLKKMREIN